MGTLISHQTAQLSSDMGALQTGASMPRFQNADKETLLGLYQQIQAHLSALADADMFTVTTVASVVAHYSLSCSGRPLADELPMFRCSDYPVKLRARRLSRSPDCASSAMPAITRTSPITSHRGEPVIKLPPHRFRPCRVQTAPKRSSARPSGPRLKSSDGWLW
jgi:hypothetical protein